MTWALGHLGWTRRLPGRRRRSASSLAVAAGSWCSATPRATGTCAGPRLSLAAVRASLAASWAHPGTRLGFWMHFSTQFSATAMSLLWGYPFFVRGEGRQRATAGALLTLIVVAIMFAGPVLGWLVGAHPWHRSTTVLTIVSTIVDGLDRRARSGPATRRSGCWSLLALVVGVGGPASMIGFDLGRTSNPAERLASASGIINQGGFLASLVLVVAIGLVLDWRTPGGSTAYPPRGVPLGDERAVPRSGRSGLTQVWRYRRRDPRAWSTATSSKAVVRAPA